ncbi:MAG: LexA family transcriptional regulator [Oscillospiraceae bacterium]|nr:LexA family transcriptional regulator [Oscillospiraceae bacterium]MDD4368082.1 LexA family transcriptional regulator [Oscillospiraceae bacterium]
MSFSDQLKRIRKAKGISQLQLAQVAGVSQQAVAKWEGGNASPDPDTLCLLAARLTCSLEDLLDYSSVVALHNPPLQQTSRDLLSLNDALFFELPAELLQLHNLQLTLRQDSMEPVYKAGDLLHIVKTGLDPDGKDCLVRTDQGACVFARVEKANPGVSESGGLLLRFFNPRYRCIHVPDAAALQILGEAIELRRPVSC